ncbi:MAG: two-component system response regulator [Frankiales bacterium]|nr:two-component system response regulator [Frankiales bacterium]
MTPTVLFVDDEPRILDGLRRGLRQHRGRWDMVFAPGGYEAIEVLQSRRVDVVVSDMRMPGMDGAHLLAWVRNHQPAAARIILSGHAEPEATLRAAVVAHRFLHKPCDLERLTEVVDGVVEAPQVDRARVAAVLGAVSALPSPPHVVARLRALLDAPDSPLASVLAVVSGDLALSATAVHLASGAFFTAAKGPVAVADAVVMLGVSTLRGLLDTAQVFWPFDETSGPQGLRVEQLSSRAVVAGQLAGQLAADSLDAEGRQHAELGALLRDVGRLACLVGETAALESDLAEAQRTGQSLEQVEVSRAGYARTEIGAALLAVWGLPTPVVVAVQHAQRPWTHGRPADPGYAARAAHLLLQDTPLREPGLVVDPAELDGLLRALRADPASAARTARELTA